MDLKRIKTVMIVILVAINAFFAYNIMSYRYDKKYIDEKTIENAIEILARSDIYIDANTFPKRKISYSIYESRFFDSYNENVVKILSGSESEKTFSLPNGMRFVAKNGDTVDISNGFEIVYLSCDANKYIAYSRIIEEALELEESSVGEDVIAPIKQKLTSDASAVVGYAEMGAECSAVYYDAVNRRYIMVFSQTMDEIPIYGNDVFCVIEDGKLIYMEGLWSFLPTDGKYSSQLTDQINILFMEKKRVYEERVEHTDSTSEDKEQSTTLKIDSIDNVYCTYLNMMQLGHARQVKVNKENTIIVGGYGESEAIKARIAQIKGAIETTTSDFDREKLQERLAKLSGGVAVIKVGAATEVEMKEKKLRIEDALNATRAAVEEGIIAGGGTSFLNVIDEVEKLLPTVEGDEKTGVQIVLKALEAPARQIAENAGFEGSVIVDKIRNNKGVTGWGFDAYNETYVDMVSAGIVDPTKVARSALQNASSIASTVLTTEAVVSDKKEENPAPAAPMGGGMGGMY